MNSATAECWLETVILSGGGCGRLEISRAGGGRREKLTTHLKDGDGIKVYRVVVCMSLFGHHRESVIPVTR
jgi:hypothetical protein